jgi:hypothetical protein
MVGISGGTFCFCHGDRRGCNVTWPILARIHVVGSEGGVATGLRACWAGRVEVPSELSKLRPVRRSQSRLQACGIRIRRSSCRHRACLRLCSTDH